MKEKRNTFEGVFGVLFPANHKDQGLSQEGEGEWEERDRDRDRARASEQISQ